jgi:hypothetical protein
MSREDHESAVRGHGAIVDDLGKVGEDRTRDGVEVAARRLDQISESEPLDRGMTTKPRDASDVEDSFGTEPVREPQALSLSI